MGELTSVKGIGAKIEKYFNNLNIFSIEELLYYFPKDYEEYQNPIHIQNIEVGKIITIDAIIITKPNVYKKGNMRITSVWLDDGTARIRAFWFNMYFIDKTLVVGKRALFRGKAVRLKNGFAMSQCKIYSDKLYADLKGKLNPIYSLTKGLTNNVVKNAIKDIIDKNDKGLVIKIEDNLNIFEEYLPKNILDERKLCSISYALSHIHFPTNYDDMVKARKRLVYDEFFIFSLATQMLNEKKQCAGRQEFVDINSEEVDNIIKNLPFELTAGQLNAINDIVNDLKKCKKINRLIEGDVGSGKTIVAFVATMITVNKNVQTAIMAPTEVLAEQHYNNFTKLCSENYKNINVALLTGSTKSAERKKILEKLVNGDINILIGTHALFSKDVIYKDLGLCIIDEQHRFGVNQRQMLEEKSNNANVIVMSATPIPRTLAMLLYANLDISKICEKPKDRLPIKNCVIGIEDREKGYKAIQKELEKGHQAYVICPAIDNDDENIGSFANYQNVVEYSKILSEYLGKNVKIAILHGKMKTADKENVMREFQLGNIDILVSTTVIEVGVDVPNATFIMIEDASAFGLAQLHQLRGRVGRGKSQSYALFVDTINTNETKKKLNVLYNSNDGFFIAEEDLKLRGPGDIFGIRQSGNMEFRIGDIYTDIKIFYDASADAKKCKNKITKLLENKLNKYISGIFIP